MRKIRQKPYHLDAFLKHNFLVQFFMVILLIVGIVSNRYLPNFWSPFNLIAVLLYLAGSSIFVWAGWFIEPYNRYHPPRDLATEGPYRFSRNPQAIASVIMILATGLVIGSFIVSGLAVLIFAYLAFFRIPSEERRLVKLFGDSYSDYCSKTRRWL